MLSIVIVNFKNPDYQDRLAILKQKSQMLGQEIPEQILSFIADKVRTSVRDLEGALKKIVAEKVFLGEEITLESVKLIIADYIKASTSTAPSVEKIQKIVAQFYGIKINDLTSKNRARSISRPRQIAMYLTKNFTRDSLPRIGQNFGGKNHATVIHSVKLIQKMIDADKNFLHEIRQIEEKVLG